MNDHSFCNDALLMQVLSSEDGCDVSRELSDHVAQCIRCQNRLHELTASDEEWSTACESLANEPLTDDSADVAQHTQSWQPFFMDGTEAAWTEAQARRILSPPSHPEMLGRLGKYEIERWIGSGGMGVVFKGFDTELNRPVAIKVLAPHLAGSGAARQRFAREARAAAAVVHEHVVPIYSVDTHGESPFLVMQYVAGESLQKRLERVGPLETCETLRIAMQIASGLAAAHEQGIIHRDIKPANILLEEGVERALITDFGLARAADDASLTNTGVHLGTPQYMSPEQARGDRLDVRSDLFSLASVMYAMCAGRAPFRAESSFGVLKKITESEPRPLRETNPSIPVWLELVVRKLHAKGPDQRYQTASEVRDLLAQCLAHAQEPTSAPLPSALKVKPSVDWHWLRVVVLLFAVVAISTCAWFASFQLRDVRETKPAQSSDSRHSGNDPIATNPEPIDPALDGLNNINDVVSSLEQDMSRLESQLLGTGSVVQLLQQEAAALKRGGPIVHSSVSVTSVVSHPPMPGDRIDLFVNPLNADSSVTETRPVLRSALVLSTSDADPDSQRDRRITLELELTQLEADCVQSYEHLQSFTYELLPSQP